MVESPSLLLAFAAGIVSVVSQRGEELPALRLGGNVALRARRPDRHHHREPEIQRLRAPHLIAVLLPVAIGITACGDSEAGNGATPTGATRTSATTSTAAIGPSRAWRARPAVPAQLRERAREHHMVVHRPADLRRLCGLLPQQTRWPVRCPPVVPRGKIDVLNRYGILRSKDFSRGYLVNAESRSIRPPGLNAPGHWTYAVGAPASLTQLTKGGRRSVPARQIGTMTLSGHLRAKVYHFPPFGQFRGMYGGHAAVVWKEGNTAFQVSAHGASNLAVAKLLARGLASNTATR